MEQTETWVHYFEINIQNLGFESNIVGSIQTPLDVDSKSF
jgi:hypothetical protein